MITSAIFIMLAAACNAVMDKLAHHFHKSIFADRDPYWWNPDVSWVNKYKQGAPLKHRMIWIFKFPAAFTDAWHLSKSLMLAAFIAAAVCYQVIVHPMLDFLIMGILFVVVFNLFYNTILAKKQ